MDVVTLRSLFKGLRDWREMYEAGGSDEIVTAAGQTYVLWDVIYLYDQIRRLPPRMRQAIQLHLYHHLKESQAAEMMGISPTNPIGQYATEGLRKIVAMIEEGRLPRFQEYEPVGEAAV